MIADEAGARAFVADRCDGLAIERLDRFVDRLADESGRQNLVSASTLGSVWRRHVADSAQLIDHAGECAEGAWVDLGSGAGFPGLVIAIMRPQIPVILIESRRLRIDWLQWMCADLGLVNCTVEGTRVEAVPAMRAATISARAFAPLPKLIALGARFSTTDTRWLLPKGRSAAQEVSDLPPRLRTMFHVEPSQTDSEAGIVVGRLAEGNIL